MTQIDEIRRERSAFERLLPELLTSHRGQFVLIKDGMPVDFFTHQQDAYRAAITRFGPNQTFLIERVERVEPSTVSYAWDAGVMFGV